jgi:hypothetical protein
VNEAANAQPSILVYKKTPDTPEYRLLHELLPPEDLQFAVRDNALKSNALYLAVLLQAQHGVRVGVYNIVNGTLLYVINPTERLDGAWVPESGFNFASLDMTKTHVLISFLTCVMIVSFSALEFEEEKQRFIFPSRSMGMDAIQIMMAIPHRALEAQPPPDRWKARISPSIWKNASESTVYMDGSIALSPVPLCSPLVRLDVNSTSIVPWSDTMTEQRFMSGMSSIHLSASLALKTICFSCTVTLWPAFRRCQRVWSTVHRCQFRPRAKDLIQLGSYHDEDYISTCRHPDHLESRRTSCRESCTYGHLD